VDGDPLPGERFAEVYREIEPYLNLVDAKAAADAAPGLTFFEVLVALAYAAFADAPVDVAAVEVGMGGSWDATSVVDAEVAVLTPISLDHQHFLGDDLSSVAREKAGIIRPGRVAVLGRQPEQVVPVLRDRLAEVGATAVRDGEEFGVLRRDVAVGGQLLTLQGLNAVYEDVFLPLHGVHQAHNAACALAAVETLLAGGAGLDGHVVEAAFAGMDSPGRMELLRRSPALLADAAHNPAGAAALADAVEESFNFDPLVGVIGVLTDKDALGILVALDGLLDSVVITRSSSPRSMDVDDLAAIAVDVFGEDRVEVVERLDDAIDVAVTRAESDGKLTGGVLLTGSITLVADARVLLGRA
ncbi:MAG: cyanophycin synthetase, partial [Kineosporiaceae bacterium]